MTTELPPDPHKALRVLIVDDEPLARLRLRQQLARLRQVAVGHIEEAADRAGTLAAVAARPFDVVLLDIAMPGDNGLRVAEALRQLPLPPAVIFVTAYGQHALAAFELAALDYLTKPVAQDRLEAALARVAQRRAASAEAAVLVIAHRGGLLRLPLAELHYLKADQKLVHLVGAGGRWQTDEALSDLEQRLGRGFVRVHRNAVVARWAVRALERAADAPAGEAAGDGGDHWVVRLHGGELLAVSRRQLALVRDALAEGSVP